MGTREESLVYAAEVAGYDYKGAKDDARDFALPDGHRNAVRVRFNRETGEVMRNSGQVGVCAPWVLQDIFSIPRSPKRPRKA